MTTTNHFIALDFGTSFIKGAVLDLDSYSMHHIQRKPFPEPIADLPPNFFEVDPKTLVAEVGMLIHALLQEVPTARGIVTTTQMHGLVLTDEAYQAQTNIITWRDQRAVTDHPSGKGSYFDHLLSQLTEPERQQLGNGIRAGLPIGTLFWLAENSALPNGTSIPLTLSEYVLANLCSGSATPQIDPTNAAAYGIFNLEEGNWHSEVIERLGLAQLQWPEIGSIHSLVGRLDYHGAKIPCYSSVGDHQCALAGAFLQNRELSLNVSTGSQASLTTTKLTLGDYETRPYFDNRFLNTIVKIPAGRSLELLVDLLIEVAQLNGSPITDPWSSITRAAAQVPETDLAINLSFYDSTSLSRSDAAAGSISNIREDNLSVGHLFRAAFQQMAQNYVDAGTRLSGGTPDWLRLVFSGGLVQKLDPLRHTILGRFAQANLESNYRICVEEEDTLLGLMVLALAISGETQSVAEATDIVSAHLTSNRGALDQDESST